METAPTSIEVLLRPTLGQSDEPSDLRGSLSPTSVYSTWQSPGGHPSNYEPGATSPNFSDRANHDERTPYSVYTRKYCSSKIPVIKGVYKTLFFTEYKVIMLFLPRGICSKKQNTLYMVWIYTREKLTIINTGLFRAQHLNYGSNVSQYWIKVRHISVNSQPFFM